MMALSQSDKREIAAMLEIFGERMTTGRYIQSPEEKVLDMIVQAVKPQIVPLGERFEASPGIQRPGDVLISKAITTALVPSKRKKAMTKFNKAVKEGMKIVRSSSSYGTKGTISNSKKAFSAVTKAVSKARKGAKLPKKGVLRKVQSKAKGILGKMAQIASKQQKRGKRDRFRIGYK
jgi:hypothetical protein